ncbi:MAG: hypothetical protein M3R72_03050 [Bacteroidota bacterium]|nr:hypothetical protein [Bacteroidota bacterium]
MFYALQMYFMNGGGTCYIVSADTYATGAGNVDDGQLQKGLDALEPEDEPTLLLFPDGQGVSTAAKYYTLQNNAIALCAKLQDRFAIIDVYDNSGNTDTNSKSFRGDPTLANGIGNNNLNYGAAYYPNLISILSYAFLRPDQAMGEGYLTPAEVAELQAIATKFKTKLYVVGSRAKGQGRNITRTDLPAGKDEAGVTTRSDIDVRIDSEVDIATSGGLSNAIANVSKGAGKAMNLIGKEATPPAIVFTPR